MSVHELEKSTETSLSEDYGQVHLTSKEIIRCRKELRGLIIAPFDKSKAKGVGYNLSLSEMIYSISRKRLVPICREVQETFFICIHTKQYWHYPMNQLKQIHALLVHFILVFVLQHKE